MSLYHTPVMLSESVDSLVTNPQGIYADATFGGGGHTAAILSRLDPRGKLIAFDRDEDADRCFGISSQKSQTPHLRLYQ